MDPLFTQGFSVDDLIILDSALDPSITLNMQKTDLITVQVRTEQVIFTYSISDVDQAEVDPRYGDPAKELWKTGLNLYVTGFTRVEPPVGSVEWSSSG